MVDRVSETSEAARLARRAVELGKDDAVLLAHAGHVLGYVAGDLAAGARAWDLALILNENAAVACGSSAFVKMIMGQHSVAVDHIARAVRLSPRDPQMPAFHHTTAFANFFLGRYDEAARLKEGVLSVYPGHLGNLRVYAASLAAAGCLEHSQKAMARYRELDPMRTTGNLDQVMPTFGRSEDHDKFVEALRQAGLPE